MIVKLRDTQSYSLLSLLLFIFVGFVHTQGISQGKQTQRKRDEGACPQDSEFIEPVAVGAEGLYFCDEYTELACCDEKQTKKIEQTVHELVLPQCERCYAMVKDWKCAECSPDSGLFYHGAQSSIRFCEQYCKAVFEACKDIPLNYNSKDPIYLNEPKDLDWEEWCYEITAKEGECFEGRYFEELDNGDCPCPSHDCHLALRKKIEREQDDRLKKRKEEKEKRRKEREAAAQQLMEEQEQQDNQKRNTDEL